MGKAKTAVFFRESGTLTLARPLLQYGKEVTTLRYDFDKVSGMQCLEALDRGHRGGEGQTDCSDRAGFLLFAEAVRACYERPEERPETADLERLHPKDVIIAARLGRGFFLRACMEALTRTGEDSPK